MCFLLSHRSCTSNSLWRLRRSPSSSLSWIVDRCLHLWIGVLLLSGLWAPSVASQSTAVAVAVDADSLAPVPDALPRAFETVDSLRNHRRFREALGLLNRLQDEHPSNVEVLYRLAFTWSDLGKAAERERRAEDFYHQAVSMAEKALAVDSTSAWAHFAMSVTQGRLTLLAGTRERVERSRAVKRHAERAIELDSTLAGAYHVRGRWHREAADLNFFQRAIVATIYGGLPAASFDQAVEDFKTAIKLETRTYHHLELGKTYRDMGRLDDAREQLRIALDVPPADPFAPEYKRDARQLLDELD